MTTVTRPTVGEVEQRTAPDLAVEGRKLRGIVPYGVQSADLGGFREVMQAGCLRGADLSSLVARVDHAGVPIGRYPGTLEIEDRDDGLHWSVELPKSRGDILEAVERQDLSAGSWRMVVAKDRWEGDVRYVEEVRSLKDVSVVCNPAYPSARAELRSEPEPDPPAPPAPEPATPEAPVPDSPKGGLQVEDRTAADDQPTVETRILEALRRVPKGEARDLATATVANVSPPQLSDFLFQRLRATSIALMTGISVLSTDREAITWPKLVSDVSPGFVAEGALIPESDPTFANLTATPKKLAVRTVVSNEVVDDSDPSIVDVLSANMSKLLALVLDDAIFEGTGASNSITGLKNTPGIQTLGLGTNGGSFSNLDPFMTAIGMLNAANAGGNYVIVMTPRAWQELSMLKIGSAYNSPLLSFPGDAAAPRIAGCPVYVSSQLSSTETAGTATTTSSVYVFAPSEVILVRRMDATIEFDRSRLFANDQSEMRGKLRADLLLPNPAAVLRITGVL